MWNGNQQATRYGKGCNNEIKRNMEKYKYYEKTQYYKTVRILTCA